MDIYLFQSILNIIWTIFSIIFVLYRFTSFFSYIYNFLKFIGRIVTYTKDTLKIFTNKSEYITRDRNEGGRETFFTRFKKGMYYIMGYTTQNTPGTPGTPDLLFDSNLHASHVTTWLNGDPNQISYSALHNSDDIDLMTMDPFAEEASSKYQGFRSVNFV